MKAIILSVQPQWVGAILNGKKTIEIRKSVPKGFNGDVYIYCTKSPVLNTYIANGKRWYLINDDGGGGYTRLNGKVVAKFTLNKWQEINNEPSYYDEWFKYRETSCVSFNEWYEYFTWGKNGGGFAWQIDNLVIFDTPISLSEFGLKHSPQSYCYVEVSTNG